MQAYCTYLLFMAANGMAEAFAYGLANEHVLNQLQELMIINAAIYIGLTLAFSHYFGIIGLIYANCINMAIRAIWSLKISIASHNKYSSGTTTLTGLATQIIGHKFFLGLVAIGSGGTMAAFYVF